MPFIIRFRRAIIVLTLMTLMALAAQIILIKTARADQPSASQSMPSATPPGTSAPIAAGPAGTPSDIALKLGKAAGAVCPERWESAECMAVISQSNYMMLANYGSDLQKAGRNGEAEQVKQHCAASTAAREQSFPAYAMKSAFIECANLLSDLVATTGMKPDMSEYQLLVGATLCLDKDQRCTAISDQLKALAAQK